MRAVHLSINWLLSTCYKCPNLALDLAAKLHNFWETWESLGAGPKIKDLMRATLSPLDQTQLDKVTDHHKHYVNPLRDQFLDEDVTLPLKKCSTKKVGYLHRFQGCLLRYTNTGTVQEIHEISHPGQVISV